MHLRLLRCTICEYQRRPCLTAERIYDVEHLKNFLMGMGETLTAFGAAPQYQYPKAGEMSADTKKLRQDFTIVGENMTVAATKAVRGENVQVKDSSSKRKGSATDSFGSRNRLAHPANRAA